MDMYILGEDFNIVDVIDDFEYLLWDTAFYKKGFFELRVPLTRLKSISHGRYVYRSDSDYTGRISTMSVDGRMVIASGNFLECLLDYRIDILGTEYAGCVETAMFNLLRSNTNGSRQIGGFTLGTDKGRGALGRFSAFGRRLSDYFYELAEAYDLSYNIRYISESKHMEFRVIEGLNRTQSQNENTRCIFSRDFGNVDSEYFETNTDYPNFAYVYGESKPSDGNGNVSARTQVEVDISSGGEKREIYVDAGNIRQTAIMSDSDYKTLLRQCGYESLTDMGRFETIDFIVGQGTTMLFGLGDICTYKHMEMGKIYDLRITEIKETHENGGIKRNIVLGRYNLGVVEAMRKGAI